MKLALPIVIVIGLALGFLVPLGNGDGTIEQSPPEAAAQTAPTAKPQPAAVAAPLRAPTETRLTRQANGHFFVEALVDGEPVDFVVDTGATAVALTVADAHRIGIPVNPGAFEVVGSGASGPVRGQQITIGSVEIDGKRVTTLRGAVIEGLDVSLLGQAYLSRITSVTMTGDQMTLR